MQERHTNRERYFNESAQTCERYYIPYIEEKCQDFNPLAGLSVFEIGCGEGGNLMPFALRGCRVTGVDIHRPRIEEAIQFFADKGVEGRFITADFLQLSGLDEQFDIIVVHDVIEHIADKRAFMLGIAKYLKKGGVVLMIFPPWQMPFGGHQQMCANKLISRFPYIHLLPNPLYRAVMKCAGEPEGTIKWQMDTKATRTTIEMFSRMARKTGFHLLDRRLYFINPHYQAKFGMKTRRLPVPLAAIPWFRNFFSTSSFWLLRAEE